MLHRREVLYIHIIVRPTTQRGWWILGSRAIRAEAARITPRPLPVRRSARRSHRSGCLSVCLSASSEGLNQLVMGKNKASSSSADQNRSSQITFMKYLSSLAGEISILMAHQAQLSQIMKKHSHCQSTAVWVGLAPSRLAWTKTCHCSGFLITNAHLHSQLIH